jgi:excisionase family DNA binding protein
MEQQLLDVKEAASRLRLKPTTIRAWILNRKIQYAKIGRRVFIRASDVDALINGSLVPPEPLRP